MAKGSWLDGQLLVWMDFLGGSKGESEGILGSTPWLRDSRAYGDDSTSTYVEVVCSGHDAKLTVLYLWIQGSKSNDI